MVYVGKVGLGVPPYKISQNEVKEMVENDLFLSNKKLKRLLPVFDNAFVDERQIVVEKDWFKKDHHFAETNDIYMTYAKKLALDAVDQCLHKSNGISVPYEEIDMIIFVSSTGIATPSMDTYILNERPFREDVIRMPLWGLGCAGGAIGLSRGFEWLALHTTKTALVICCELCSLTFQKKDLSTSNIVGTAIFGDGVAATLLIGEDSPFRNKLPKHRLQLKANHSMTKKNSTDVMGWKITKTGFEVIFSKRIPKLIPTLWKEHIHSFLKREGISIEDITSFVAHPGGRKVLEEMSEIPGITDEKLQYSYHVLKKHGNMSSATVLYVLKQWLEGKRKSARELGILSALGPGFSSELLLAEWVTS